MVRVLREGGHDSQGSGKDDAGISRCVTLEAGEQWMGLALGKD